MGGGGERFLGFAGGSGGGGANGCDHRSVFDSVHEIGGRRIRGFETAERPGRAMGAGMHFDPGFCGLISRAGMKTAAIKRWDGPICSQEKQGGQGEDEREERPKVCVNVCIATGNREGEGDNADNVVGIQSGGCDAELLSSASGYWD